VLDKILWWVSLSCLGLFANLLIGGLLSWSDRKTKEVDGNGSTSERWMWTGLRVMYILFFVLSCVIMGMGMKTIANMMGL
jgi:hypothetical protein